MFVWMTGQPPSPPLASKILSNLQKDYEDHRAVWATYALVQLKPIPKEILSAVLAKARNVTEDIKVQIIGALTASDPDLVNELAAILDDPAERHQDAVMALSDLGIAAKDAEPALRRFAARRFQLAARTRMPRFMRASRSKPSERSDASPHLRPPP